MYTWNAGDEITAERLNQANPGTATLTDSLASRLSKSERNILELYLDNYYSGKNTPSQGIFYDGFIDTAKAGTGSGVISANASAGQNYVKLTTETELAGFNVGDTVTLYNSTVKEDRIVSSKVAGTSDSTLSGWNYAETESRFADQGVVSNCREIRWDWGSNPPSGMATLTKTFNVTAGQQFTLTLTARCRQTSGSLPNFDTVIKADGTQIGTKTFTGNADETYNFSVTFTPAAATTTITIESKWTGSGSGSSSMYVLWDYSNLVLDGGKKLVFTTNIANAYTATAGYAKRNTATIDTANSRLTPTASVADGSLFTYHSAKQVFNQDMASAKIWLSRSRTPYNLDSGIAGGATSLSMSGDQTSEFATGDTIDIYKPDNVTRERKTLTGSTYTGVALIGTVAFQALSGSGTMTLNVTVPAGTNYLMAVFEGQSAFSSVTFNSQALTQYHTATATFDRVDIWGKVNPPIGTYTLSYYQGGNSAVKVFCFKGVDTTTPVSNFGDTGNVNLTSVTVTTTPGSIAMLGSCIGSGNPSSLYTGLNSGSIDLYQYGNYWSYNGIYRRATSTSETISWTPTINFSNHAASYWSINAPAGVTAGTSLTFTPATTSAFTTSDYVERVSVKPKLSIVAHDAAESFGTPIYVSTLVQNITNPITVKQNTDSGSNLALYGGTGTNEAIGQVINEDHTGGKLSKIRLKLSKQGGPADAVRIKIYSGTTPGSGTLLGTSDVIASAAIGTSSDDYIFTFPSPVTLANGWYFYIERTGSQDSTNYIVVYHSSSQAYAISDAYYRSSGTWTALGSNRDLYFIASIDLTETYAEDEYTYTPASAGKDVVARIELTRNSTSLTPKATRLGVSLNI